MLFAHASVTTNVLLGRHVHVNTRAAIAHDGPRRRLRHDQSCGHDFRQRHDRRRRQSAPARSSYPAFRSAHVRSSARGRSSSRDVEPGVVSGRRTEPRSAPNGHEQHEGLKTVETDADARWVQLGRRVRIGTLRATSVLSIVALAVGILGVVTDASARKNKPLERVIRRLNLGGGERGPGGASPPPPSTTTTPTTPPPTLAPPPSPTTTTPVTSPPTTIPTVRTTSSRHRSPATAHDRWTVI